MSTDVLVRSQADAAVDTIGRVERMHACLMNSVSVNPTDPPLETVHLAPRAFQHCRCSGVKNLANRDVNAQTAQLQIES